MHGDGTMFLRAGTNQSLVADMGLPFVIYYKSNNNTSPCINTPVYTTTCPEEIDRQGRSKEYDLLKYTSLAKSSTNAA